MRISFTEIAFPSFFRENLNPDRHVEFIHRKLKQTKILFKFLFTFLSLVVKNLIDYLRYATINFTLFAQSMKKIGKK